MTDRSETTGLLAGVGLAGTVAVCRGATLLLAGGLIAGLAAGWLRYWPLLLIAAALAALAAWRRWRRHHTGCPTPADDAHAREAPADDAHTPSQ